MPQHAPRFGPLAGPLIHPPRAHMAVLLSVPHAGRDYPASLVDLSRSGIKSLERLEDPLVDRLAWRAIAAGVGAVVARAPRAAIDMNRGEDELDPRAIEDVALAVGPRARAGLGLLPSRLAGHGVLWRGKVDRDELEARLADAYRPYHAAIGARLDDLWKAYGEAVLLDLHSMPTRPGAGLPPQWIVGDRFGTSAAPGLARIALDVGRRHGFTVAHNDPFAGGEIVARHGRPADGVHALQLEIDRKCYLGPDGRTPGAGFDRVALAVEALVKALADAVSRPSALAAE